MGREIEQVLTSLARYGNLFGASPRARPKWTQELDFHIKDARKQRVEYLWFVGDYASYDPRVQPATRAAARIFRRAGLDFGILYESEVNSGNDARGLGEDGLFEALRDKNIQALDNGRYARILTTDPHTYHALTKGYSRRKCRIVHYTELLDELFLMDRLFARKKLDLKATFHDPCYLGGYGKLYRAPRHVLHAIGVTLIEMRRNFAKAFCCGAYEGRAWTGDFSPRGERPAESRVREAARLQGVRTMVVCCPQDLVMFHEALRTAGLTKNLAVRDIAELVEEATAPP